MELIPSNFIREIKDQPCVLFIGAGLSSIVKNDIGEKFPSWKELISQMIADLEKLSGSPISPRYLQKLRQDLQNPNSYTHLANIYKRRADSNTYLSFMKERLTITDVNQAKTPLHNLILNMNFHGFITTNLDNIIEANAPELIPIIYPDYLKFPNSIKKERFYLKLHGCIKHNKWVITSKEYSALTNDKRYKAILQSILLSKTILTVGYSINDPDLLSVLKDLKLLFGKNSPVVFSLMKRASVPINVEIFLKNNYNIKIIPYETHEDLLNYFLELSVLLTKNPPNRNNQKLNPQSPKSRANALDLKKINGPEDYHEDRVNCSVYQTLNNAVNLLDNDYYVNNIESWKELEKKFNQLDGNGLRFEPAGSWYLVREQANFLKTQLVEIFATFEPGSKVRILEAGSASFVHHFTYLSIIFEALKEVRNHIQIEITVIDKYAFPICQILEVSKMIKLGELNPGVVVLENFPPFEIHEDFCNFIDQKFDKDIFIKTKTTSDTIFRFDLTELKFIEKELKFDIITEHFLTYPSGYYDWVVKMSRTNYYRFCDKRLYLIAAMGDIIEKVKKYFDYFEYHKKLGFMEIRKQKIWDPYDLEEKFSRNAGDKLPSNNFQVCWVLKK